MSKQDWTYKKLGEVATFINGYPFKPSDWKDSGRKIIRIQNLNNPNAVYNFYDGSIDPKYLVSNGDVLISWSGSLGVFEWTEDEAILNQHIFKVVFNKEYINKKFFQYVVASRINEMKSKVHGVTMQHITKKEFDIILIPVPPIGEQERIVAELDLLQGIIEKKKEQLKAYDQLAQSIFYTMFGDPETNSFNWDLHKLGSYVTVKGGFAFKSNKYTHSGVRLVQIANVWKDKLTWGEITHISNEDAFASRDFMLDNGDIVMAMTRPIIKSLEAVKVAIVTDKDLPCILNQRVCKFEILKDLNSTWLYQFLRHPYFKSKIHQFGSKGMQPNVSSREIESIPLIVPPISLQQEFAEKVEAIERQKALVQESIEETQTMFDYTMDKYFG